MKILFVCLGNICRSPLAEELFRKHVRLAGLENKIQVDSCGTGDWHSGELPDPRMRDTAAKNGLDLTHRARVLRANDFEDFDSILVMDHHNLEDVIALAGQHRKKVKMMTDLSPTHRGNIVPDPYFGDVTDFENVYKLLDELSAEIVQFYNQ